jgi:hypothetical protein
MVSQSESGAPFETYDRKVNCLCALTEHHAMEAYWGSGGIALLIL